MNKKIFYSNGKLLITGEYTVLDGALALALPTVFGQEMSVEENTSEQIVWKSFDKDNSVWIDVQFTFEQLKNKAFVSENPLESTLADILFEAYLLQPKFLEKNIGYLVTTTLTFPRFWGLGTSSTLINNVATWLDINPFDLLEKTFGGSGYDIACARYNTPIFYQLDQNLPVITPVVFHPNFTEHLYFVYLNKKQNSRLAIASYKENKLQKPHTISEINQITHQITRTGNVEEFATLLDKHEQLMSEMLHLKTVKQSLFPDFDGTLKSLGAWGGDFVLAVAKDNPTDYFKAKGYDTVIPYKDMILTS